MQDLWNGHLSPWIAWFFDPLRDFLLDPMFAIGSHLLPPLAKAIPGADTTLAVIIRCNLFVLRGIYRLPDEQSVDLRRTARQDIIVNNKAGLRLPKFKPPSDLASAFRGAVAFTTSVVADIVSVFMDRKKMGKWLEALTEFKGYLDASGVGGELDESIMKPLLRLRLVDNVKILNDIQSEMYADRCRAVSSCSADDLKDPLIEGKR
jgi:hypothetical protein